MRAHLIATVAASVLGGLFAIQASAEPARRSGDIVNFFTTQPATPGVAGHGPQGLGASRGLCIGTESECGVPPPPKPAAGLNLLVNFDLNSDRLTPQAKENLNEFVKALQDPRLAGQSFAVEGYTDATGTPQYNLDLSSRRAEAVVKYLDAAGVKSTRLSAKGFGEGHPIGSGPYDPLNRRVEMRRAAN